MADTPLRALKRRAVSPTAGVPVSAPSTLRVAKIRSLVVTSIGSLPTLRAIETPPGRSPLNVAATVLLPAAVDPAFLVTAGVSASRWVSSQCASAPQGLTR